MASLFEVVGGWRRGASEPWAQAMLERAAGIDLAPFGMFCAPERIVPDTFTPVPARSARSWAQALEELRTLPAAATHDELAGMLAGRQPSPELQPWLDEPVRMWEAYLDAADRWWHAVLAPEWPRMLALLETEVLRVGRLLATEGPGPTLAAVHPRIEWDGRHLRLPLTPTVSADCPLDDRRFALLPMACGPEGLLCGKDHPEYVTVAYAAPGTAALFSLGCERSPNLLAEALGAGRAAVLRALDVPRPLRVIGMEVGLAPSTVHSHVQALMRSGLVDRARFGSHVFYARSVRGSQLVDLF